MSEKQTILPDVLTDELARMLSLKAAEVFQPRTPINNRDLFAGRWDQITSLADSVSQVGLHVVIYGERGVGKTSLANVVRPLLEVFTRREDRIVIKVSAHDQDDFSSLWRKALEEIAWNKTHTKIGFNAGEDASTTNLFVEAGLTEPIAPDAVRRVLGELPGAVFVFDEFDRMPRKNSTGFTDLIKMLSDNAVQVTIILVGVAETVDKLIADHASIPRSLIQIPMPRMKAEELSEILKKAMEKLGVRFDEAASNRVVRMSQGLPHYTHLIGLQAVREAFDRLSSVVSVSDVENGARKAVNGVHQDVTNKYAAAVRSAHKDALYSEALIACAIAASAAPDDLGFFQPVDVVAPMSKIIKRDVAISTFARHLTEFCSAKRSSVLERIGEKRMYRYRFRDPLLPPFVIMKGMAEKLVTTEQVEELTRTSDDSSSVI